jgi:hypothetical protein
LNRLKLRHEGEVYEDGSLLGCRQKTAIFVFNAVRTSDPTLEVYGLNCSTDYFGRKYVRANVTTLHQKEKVK